MATPNEVPAFSFVAPSRLGSGDKCVVGELRFAIHVPRPHHVKQGVVTVGMSGLFKREAEDRVIALTLCYPRFNPQAIKHNVDWWKARQVI